MLVFQIVLNLVAARVLGVVSDGLVAFLVVFALSRLPALVGFPFDIMNLNFLGLVFFLLRPPISGLNLNAGYGYFMILIELLQLASHLFLLQFAHLFKTLDIGLPLLVQLVHIQLLDVDFFVPLPHRIAFLLKELLFFEPLAIPEGV